MPFFFSLFLSGYGTDNFISLQLIISPLTVKERRESKSCIFITVTFVRNHEPFWAHRRIDSGRVGITDDDTRESMVSSIILLLRCFYVCVGGCLYTFSHTAVIST